MGEKPVEFLDNFGSDLPLLEILGDEGVADDVPHLHPVVGVLLADLQDEVLPLLADVDVLWELDLVLDLGGGRGTIRFRSS